MTPPSSDALAVASALIAAELGGTSLKTRTLSESGTVGSGGLIHLRDGPCTAIQSLTLNGASAVGVLQSPWIVNVGNLPNLYGWGFGTGPQLLYTVTYTAGWADADLPEQIKQAMALTVAQIDARPDPSLRSESMGPMSKSWDVVAGVPTQAALLLAPWRALRF